MTLKSRLGIVAWGTLVVVLCLALSGGVAAKTLKVAMITPYGAGEPFDGLAFKGLQDAQKDLKVQIKLVEARDKAEYPVQIRGMAELGYDVIIGLHDYLAKDMIAIAKEFPRIKFVLLDSYLTEKVPNYKAVAMEPQEGSFVAGVVAARATKTKHIGFIGGLDHPIIIQFLAGFEAGIKYVDPSIKLSTAFSGVFDDPNKGRELALNMYSKDIDVIMHAAAMTGLGVLKASQETGKYAIGVDLDQSDVAPGHVLISALKDARGATYRVVKSIVKGKFTPGLEVFGANQGVQLVAIPRDIAFYKEHPAVLKEVDQVITKLKQGQIQVPKSTTTR